MPAIFDSHAHYDSKRFDDIRDEILSEMPENGVCGIINAGTDVASSEFSVRLAEQYPFIYAAVGIHPHEAESVPADYLARLKEMSRHPKVVAIGEIGLDYHYEFSPRDIQKTVLCQELELAQELSMPVILHDRESHEDMYNILRKYRPRGVMHCFSGSVELMKEAVAMGLYIGIGGVLTFHNARVPIEVAQALPLERLLLETDAPYLSPVPYRKKINISPYIIRVAETLAELRGLPVDEILTIAENNTRELFSI